jgi:hypothetical protein
MAVPGFYRRGPVINDLGTRLHHKGQSLYSLAQGHKEYQYLMNDLLTESPGDDDAAVPPDSDKDPAGDIKHWRLYQWRFDGILRHKNRGRAYSKLHPGAVS